MLHGRLELHGVDAEALMARVIDRSGAVAALRPPLRQHERDDLLAHLIVVVWQLSLVYEPQRGPGRGHVSFSTFAYTTASLRVVDWIRSERKRTRWKFNDRIYERPLPDVVSLDDERSGLVEFCRREVRRSCGQWRSRSLLGYSSREIARELRTSSSWVSSRLDELADELEQLHR